MTLVVTTEDVLNRVVAPRLLTAPMEYDHRFMDQYTNVLRLYFNQLDNILGQLNTATTSDGSSLSFPNGCFTSNANQTAASTTTAYNVQLDTTEAADDISLVGGYQIVVAKAGRYNFQFSIQLANLANSTESIDIWFHHNGNDVPRSNSRFGMAARKTPTIPFYCIGTVNTFIDLAAGDNVSLQWHTTNVDTKIQADTAGTSPTRPAIPSVIFTATFVSKV